MLLDLREMRRPEGRIDRSYGVGDLPAEQSDGYRVKAPVRLTIRVLKDGTKYRLVGQIDTTLELECCRCLEPFDLPIRSAVDLLYLPYSENNGEGESEISDEDLSTAFYRDEQIDLDTLVREQLQLALPMKPLCVETCRGLCPKCGVNRNREGCSCDTSWHDPRLVALESLLSDGRKG